MNGNRAPSLKQEIARVRRLTQLFAGLLFRVGIDVFWGDSRHPRGTIPGSRGHSYPGIVPQVLGNWGLERLVSGRLVRPGVSLERRRSDIREERPGAAWSGPGAALERPWSVRPLTTNKGLRAAWSGLERPGAGLERAWSGPGALDLRQQIKAWCGPGGAAWSGLERPWSVRP